ncbi:hypothetical protein Hanom_Chr01g00053651 [Helianthus anomalus]
MMENYFQRKFERVENALNIKLKSVSNEVNQLSDDINVIYTKSDVCESALVNDVVEKVFDGEKQNDFTKNENSKSKFEDEESFHKNYLKNSKYDSKMNNDPIRLMYQMVGSDKLFSDIEFSVQNVIVEKFEKVFKLVKIELSEVENHATNVRNWRKGKSFL